MRLLATVAVCCAAWIAGAQIAGPGVWEWKVSPEVEAWQKDAPEGVKVWDGVKADRRDGTVRILAEATGVSKGIEAEFLLIGAKSDRAYESLLVAKCNGGAVMEAMAWLGVPEGWPTDPLHVRFWPKGERVSMGVRLLSEEKVVPITEWIRDLKGGTSNVLAEGFAYVGRRGWDETKMPAPIVSFYNDEQTLFDLPFKAAKGAVYGRFRIGRQLKVNEKAEVVLKVMPAADGKPRVVQVDQRVSPEMSAADVVRALRERVSPEHDVYVRLLPDGKVSVAQMKELAQVVALVEGPDAGGIRLDTPPADGFYPPAFNPSDDWRNRKERPFQPWELHLGASNVLVQVIEDWNVEGLDPKLSTKRFVLEGPGDVLRVANLIDNPERAMRTVLVFAPGNYPVGELRRWLAPVRERLPQVWVFVEEEAKQ